MSFQGVDIVGVIACILAAGSLLWQWKTWRESHREYVRVSLKWETGHEGSSYQGPRHSRIVAEVVNLGRLPVYVKEVVFERKAENEPKPSFGPGPEHGIVRMKLERYRGQQNPLNVGEGHLFYLPEQGSGFLQRFIDTKYSWLVVRSERQVLCRLRHNKFTQILQRLIDTLKPIELRELKELQESVARTQDALQQE